MAHELLEASASAIEQPVCAEHRGDESFALGYWPLDRPFPALLTDGDLMTVLGIGRSTFYRFKKLGRFDVLKAQLRLTDTTRYSGELVRRFVRGEWTYAVSFGGKRQRRNPAVAVLHDRTSVGASTQRG